MFLVASERAKMPLHIVLCEEFPYGLIKFVGPFSGISLPRNFRKLNLRTFSLRIKPR